MYAPGTIRASLVKLRGVLLRGVINVDLSRSREYVAKVTPPKFSMEPEHDDFQKDFPISRGWSSGSILNFRGVHPKTPNKLLHVSFVVSRYNWGVEI